MGSRLTESFRGPSVSLHEKPYRLPFASVSDERFAGSGPRQSSDVGVLSGGRQAYQSPVGHRECGFSSWKGEASPERGCTTGPECGGQ
jgi:hypothetical protein